MDIMEMIDERITRLEKSTAERFNRIDQKLDTVVYFKWKVIGGLLAVVFLIPIVVKLMVADA